MKKTVDKAVIFESIYAHDVQDSEYLFDGKNDHTAKLSSIKAVPNTSQNSDESLQFTIAETSVELEEKTVEVKTIYPSFSEEQYLKETCKEFTEIFKRPDSSSKESGKLELERVELSNLSNYKLVSSSPLVISDIENRTIINIQKLKILKIAVFDFIERKNKDRKIAFSEIDSKQDLSGLVDFLKSSLDEASEQEIMEGILIKAAKSVEKRLLNLINTKKDKDVLQDYPLTHPNIDPYRESMSLSDLSGALNAINKIAAQYLILDDNFATKIEEISDAIKLLAENPTKSEKTIKKTINLLGETTSSLFFQEYLSFDQKFSKESDDIINFAITTIAIKKLEEAFKNLTIASSEDTAPIVTDLNKNIDDFLQIVKKSSSDLLYSSDLFSDIKVETTNEDRDLEEICDFGQILSLLSESLSNFLHKKQSDENTNHNSLSQTALVDGIVAETDGRRPPPIQKKVPPYEKNVKASDNETEGSTIISLDESGEKGNPDRPKLRSILELLKSERTKGERNFDMSKIEFKKSFLSENSGNKKWFNNQKLLGALKKVVDCDFNDLKEALNSNKDIEKDKFIKELKLNLGDLSVLNEIDELPGKKIAITEKTKDKLIQKAALKETDIRDRQKEPLSKENYNQKSPDSIGKIITLVNKNAKKNEKKTKEAKTFQAKDWFNNKKLLRALEKVANCNFEKLKTALNSNEDIRDKQFLTELKLTSGDLSVLDAIDELYDTKRAKEKFSVVNRNVDRKNLEMMINLIPKDETKRKEFFKFEKEQNFDLNITPSNSPVSTKAEQFLQKTNLAYRQ